MIQMKMYMNLRRVFLLLRLRFVNPTRTKLIDCRMDLEMHLFHNNSHHLYGKMNLKSSSTSFLFILINPRQWREERNLQIQRREEISQKKKQEITEQAKQAIDDFYENYNNQKEKAIAQTRYAPLFRGI